MKQLKIVLSVVYWLIVGGLLWLGYIGDVEIDRASAVPVTHSPAFDITALFVLAAIAYGAACAIWWGMDRLRRKAA